MKAGREIDGLHCPKCGALTGGAACNNKLCLEGHYDKPKWRPTMAIKVTCDRCGRAAGEVFAHGCEADWANTETLWTWFRRIDDTVSEG